MILIGISGEMGTGKDTIADILVRDHDFFKVSVGKYVRMEFCEYPRADLLGCNPPVKVRGLVAQGGLDLRSRRVHQKPTPPDVREALQWFGQLMVTRRPSHWIERVVCEIRDSGHDRVVWSDIRRVFEFSEVKRLGGHTWRVDRDLIKRRKTDIVNLLTLPHNTESEWKDLAYDATLCNNYTKAKLATRINKLVQGIERNQK